MLTDDIKKLNDHHANLKHYNKNVAESWYRIRDLMERIKELFEEKFNSTAAPAQHGKVDIKPRWCGYNKDGCLHINPICSNVSSGGCTFHRPV